MSREQADWLDWMPAFAGMTKSKEPTSSRLIVVGAILGAHGVRGEVRLRSFTEEPRTIARYGALLTADGRPLEIVSLKPAKDGFTARLKGVDTRDEAEALKGTELFIPRERLPDEKGAWYHADLAGLQVFDVGGLRLGTVTDVRNYGAGDLLEIERPGRPSALVPFTDAFVPHVDLVAGRLTINPPEGLLDD
ncbi:MAG: ribosome maturation factor RimM [Parvibaculaceae bacterium]